MSISLEEDGIHRDALLCPTIRHEFERPLVRYDVGERAVRSRVRFGVRRGRFEILLAPGRKTLSESVRPQEERRIRRRPVMGMLADDSFVSGAPLHKGGLDRGAISLHSGTQAVRCHMHLLLMSVGGAVETSCGR